MQALRASLFGIRDLRPQEPWIREKQTYGVSWFRAKDAQFWKRFRESKSFILIVPCSEGEELAYVKGDDVLREQIEIYDGVPQNVLSATRAKGCEYDSVVVYGFGQSDGGSIDRWRRSSELERQAAQGDALGLEYFVNRLYVAVSRPKRRLIVVDSDDGLTGLWKYATDENAERELLDSVNHGHDIWGRSIQGMIQGDPEYLIKDVGIDPIENAKAFERDGLSRKDAFLMRQAAQAYRASGNNPKFRECRARAMDFDENWLEAGSLYVEAGFEYPDGIRCLWKSGLQGWKDLARMQSVDPNIKGSIEYRMSMVLAQKESAEQLTTVLKALKARCGDPDFFNEHAGSSLWKDAIQFAFDRLNSIRPSIVTIAEWRELAKAAGDLSDFADVVPLAALALAHFNAGNYTDAIKAWERTLKPQSREYLLAKTYVDTYPANISALHELADWERIESLYHENETAQLTETQAESVVHALQKRGAATEAISLAEQHALANILVSASLQKRADGDNDAAADILQKALRLSAEAGRWAPLEDLFCDRVIPTRPSSDAEESQWYMRQRPRLYVTALKALARSQHLPEAPEDFKKKLSAFLRRQDVGSNAPWHGQMSALEFGAVFERVGHRKDAIKFYETVKSHTRDESERAEAKIRFLVCRERQLRHDLKAGSTGRTRAVERELRAEAARLGERPLSEYPEYPELAPIPNTAAIDAPPAPGVSEPIASNDYLAIEDSKENKHHIKAIGQHPGATPLPESNVPNDRMTATLGSYEFEFSRNKKRINIKHRDSMETAIVKFHPLIVTSEAGNEKQADGSWLISAWSLSVSVANDQLKLTIEDRASAVGMFFCI